MQQRESQQLAAAACTTHMLSAHVLSLSPHTIPQGLLVKFNKARQAKITQEISEIVAGANATG